MNAFSAHFTNAITVRLFENVTAFLPDGGLEHNPIAVEHHNHGANAHYGDLLDASPSLGFRSRVVVFRERVVPLRCNRGSANLRKKIQFEVSYVMGNLNTSLFALRLGVTVILNCSNSSFIFYN